MSYIDEIKEIRDKTTVKGAYLFLSISIFSFIFIKLGILDLKNFSDPISIFYTYTFFITTVSIGSLIFYYLQIFAFLINIWIKIKGFFLDYPKYKNVTFSQTLNSIYIRKTKNFLISKTIFTISLFILSLIFWNIELTSFMIGIFIILFLFVSILNFITLLAKKRTYFIFTIFLFLTIGILDLLSILFYSNYYPLIFSIPLILLNITIIFDWKKLERRLKLIYFRDQFIQAENLNFKDNRRHIRDFCSLIREGLWNESRFSFGKILEKNLNQDVLSTKEEFLKNVDFIKKILWKLQNINKTFALFNKINYLYKIKKNENFHFEEVKINEFRSLLNDISATWDNITDPINSILYLDDWLIFYLLDINKKEQERLDDFIKKVDNIKRFFEKSIGAVFDPLEKLRREPNDNHKKDLDKSLNHFITLIKRNHEILETCSQFLSKNNKTLTFSEILTYLSTIQEKYYFLKREAKIKSKISSFRVNELKNWFKKKYILY